MPGRWVADLSAGSGLDEAGSFVFVDAEDEEDGPEHQEQDERDVYGDYDGGGGADCWTSDTPGQSTYGVGGLVSTEEDVRNGPGIRGLRDATRPTTTSSWFGGDYDQNQNETAPGKRRRTSATPEMDMDMAARPREDRRETHEREGQEDAWLVEGASSPAWDSSESYGASGYGYVSLSEALLNSPPSYHTTRAASMAMARTACTYTPAADPGPSTDRHASVARVEDFSPTFPHIRPDDKARNTLRRRRRRRRSSKSSVDDVASTPFDGIFTHPLSGLSLVMGYNTALPKSRLDMYITALRQLVLGAGERGSLG